MIYVSNCIQWVIAFIGIQKLGAVIVPVSPIYTSHELDYMVRDSGAETLICLDTNFCYVKEVMDQTGLKRVIVTNLVDLLPPWKRYLGVLFDKIPNGKVDNSTGVFSFISLLRHEPLRTPAEIDPMTDLSYLLYTGGTTGFPKGVPGNHSGMTSYVNDVTQDVAGDRLLEGRDVYIAINPMFHHHGPWPVHVDRPEQGQYNGADARPSGGCHSGKHSAVSCALASGCARPVPDDPG